VSRVVDVARTLWRNEPVIVRTALPQLVSLGLLTAHQADALSATLAAVGSLVVEVVGLVGAFRARSKVTPTK
jgi:hypothetical protein